MPRRPIDATAISWTPAFYLLAALVGLSSSCSPPRHDFYGHWISCPWTGLTGLEVTLSASRASMRGFGDQGGWSADMTGTFRVHEEQLVVSFTSGEWRKTSSASPEPVAPHDWHFAYRRFRELRILGPVTRITNAPEFLGSAPMLLFMFRVAPLSEELPGVLECPSEIDALVAEQLTPG